MRRMRYCAASGRPEKSGEHVLVRWSWRWSWRWEREGLGKFRWVVSEVILREMNFFRRVSGAREVVIEKMMGRPPPTDLYMDIAVIFTRVEWEVGSV